MKQCVCSKRQSEISKFFLGDFSNPKTIKAYRWAFIVLGVVWTLAGITDIIVPVFF